MPQPKRDISREVQCPKCGYDPDHAGRDEYRHNTIYNPERNELLLSCARCSYNWTEQPLDAEQPKVVKR